MKIAHVLAWVSRNAGGLFNSVSGLASATAALDGTTVRVFGVADEFTRVDAAQWLPVLVKASRVSGPSRLCYTPDMPRELDAFAPHIVHSAAVWTFQAAIVNRLHSRAGIPYVLSTRGTLDPWALQRSRRKKALARLFYQQRHFDRAACIHALSESELKSIRQFGLQNPVCVIPNGIDIPEVESRPSLRSPGESGNSEASRQKAPWEDGVEPGRKVLLYLGRIHPKKGLVNLLRAWSETQKRRRTGAPTGWMLAIAGWDEGGHEAELKQLATELGMCWADIRDPASDLRSPTSIIFLGPQFGADKAACYRDCDAFVLPSFSEGLPMTVLEAWSYGRPVLMTSACNLPEGFAAGAALRTEATEKCLVRGLAELLGAPDTDRINMGARGRALVASRFAWPGIAQDMKAVYDWVLGGGTAPKTVHQ